MKIIKNIALGIATAALFTACSTSATSQQRTAQIQDQVDLDHAIAYADWSFDASASETYYAR